MLNYLIVPFSLLRIVLGITKIGWPAVLIGTQAMWSRWTWSMTSWYSLGSMTSSMWWPIPSWVWVSSREALLRRKKTIQFLYFQLL